MRSKSAPQFKTDRKNRKKNTVFHLLVGVLLLFVLVATCAPLLASASVVVINTFETIKSNLSPQKKVAINPLAPSFKDLVKSKLDPSTFEVKDSQEIDSYSLQVTSNQGVVAIFSNLGDLDKQVSSLQTLLVKSRIEAKRVKKIDLRFNKTIVEYEAK